jgi:hypothetical protein
MSCDHNSEALEVIFDTDIQLKNFVLSGYNKDKKTTNMTSESVQIDYSKDVIYFDELEYVNFDDQGVVLQSCFAVKSEYLYTKNIMELNKVKVGYADDLSLDASYSRIDLALNKLEAHGDVQVNYNGLKMSGKSLQYDHIYKSLELNESVKGEYS